MDFATAAGATGGYAGKVLDAVNPIASRPSGPMESLAMLDSLQPSLMPRSSLHQGVVTGVSILAARGASGGLQRLVNLIVPAGAGLGVRIGVQGAIAGTAAAGMRLPNGPEAPLAVAIARSLSGWTLAAAVGGVIHDGGRFLGQQYEGQRRLRGIALGAAATTGVLLAGRRMLRQRQQLLVPGPQPPVQKVAVLAASTGATVLVGRALHVANRSSGRAINRWFGPGPSKRVASGLVNAALWGAGSAALYWAFISKVGNSNENLDPGYDTPPTHATASGGPNSHVPYDEIGREGRRYVTDIVPAERIEATMGEPARAVPVRAYVGFNTDPLSFQRRSELALDELERLGGFERSTLLLVSATGTGWVDDAMIAAAELAARGDLASVCVQYGRYPSFLSVQKVAQGRRQFRILLYGVHQRLRAVPPEQRPRVVIFGESLGAWTSSDSLLAGGELRFEHYGVERALWFGMPDMALMGRKGKDGPASAVQTGVALVDRADQLDVLERTEREQVQALILSHDNDPIAKLGAELIFRRPEWLGDNRGRGVPSNAEWSALITFLQTAIDAANAMKVIPGEFYSTGHDYRGDTAWFVSHGLGFDVNADQLARMEATLRELELERHARLAKPKVVDADKTKGARWFSRWLPHRHQGGQADRPRWPRPRERRQAEVTSAARARAGVLLALASVIALAGCGSSSGDTSAPSTSRVATTSATATTAVPVTDATLPPTPTTGLPPDASAADCPPLPPPGDPQVGDPGPAGVMAFGIDDGALSWEVEVPGRSVVTPAGEVVVASDASATRAYDAAGGALRWCRGAGGDVVSVGDLVVVAHPGQPIVGLDAATGAVRWTSTERVPEGLTVGPALIAGVHSVYLDHGAVDPAGGLTALDAATGRPVWSWKASGCDGAAVACVGGPVSLVESASGVHLLDQNAGRLVTLDVATGGERWHAGLSGQLGRPAVGEDVVVVPVVEIPMPAADGAMPPSQGALHALDAVTGTERWSFPWTVLSVDAGDGIVVSIEQTGAGSGDPSVAPPDLGTDVVARDARTGAVRWRRSLPGELPLTVTVADGLVLLDVTSIDGGGPGFLALAAADGSDRWRVEHPSPFTTPTFPSTNGYERPAVGGAAGVLVSVIRSGALTD